MHGKNYGIFYQLYVDKGQEWNLMLFMNTKLEQYRYDRSKVPHVQISSKKVSSEDFSLNPFDKSVCHKCGMHLNTIR